MRNNTRLYEDINGIENLRTDDGVIGFPSRKVIGFFINRFTKITIKKSILVSTI